MNIWTTITQISKVSLVLLAISLIAHFFYPKYTLYRDLQRRESELREGVRLEEDMLQLLKTKQERLRNDPRFVEKIAREELGLAKPGETVFKFVDDVPTNSSRRRP